MKLEREGTNVMRLPEDDRRGFASRLLQIQDEERRKIAQELHDSTGHLLAAVARNLSRAQESEDLPPEMRRLLSESSALVQECVESTRSLTHLLHPPLLDELGLTAAVREYAQEFSRRSGVEVKVDVPSHRLRLGHERERALFRVAQECLSNVYRHSGSATATVRILPQKEEIRLEVEDLGRGIPREILREPEGNQVGVGIRGMRERMQLLGGRLEIDSKEGRTTIAAVAPVVD